MVIKISRRAGLDLEEIAEYSTLRWGKRVADDYLDSIDFALQTLAENPDLLRNIPEISGVLKWYRVKQHFLVCEVVEPVIYVVTIKHCHMDIPARLNELEPTLMREVEIMHHAFLHHLKQDG